MKEIKLTKVKDLRVKVENLNLNPLFNLNLPTKINGKYWDRAWSLVDGCTPCSPGCDNCWSRDMGKRFHKWPEEVTPRWDRLGIPLKVKKPTVWAIWNDLFHEDVPLDFIDNALDVMSGCRQHTFLVLTKRTHLVERKLYDVIPEYGIRSLGGGDCLSNLWVGATICNQPEADEKISLLLKAWPGKKWISIEPMLGPVDISPYLKPYIRTKHDGSRRGREWTDPGLDWVVLGGETGPNARPMHPDWVRSVRDQCQAAGVPFFFKQWGRFKEVDAQTFAEAGYNFHLRNGGRMLDGREHNDLPWR
jgi:protein gp37